MFCSLQVTDSLSPCLVWFGIQVIKSNIRHKGGILKLFALCFDEQTK